MSSKTLASLVRLQIMKPTRRKPDIIVIFITLRINGNTIKAVYSDWLRAGRFGIESRWGGGDFPHLSRPVLGSTQPPVQWVPGLSRGKERPGRDADPSPLPVLWFKKKYSYTSTPPMGRTACTEPQCLYKGALY